jgi:hypothetical protein
VGNGYLVLSVSSQTGAERMVAVVVCQCTRYILIRLSLDWGLSRAVSGSEPELRPALDAVKGKMRG